MNRFYTFKNMMTNQLAILLMILISTVANAQTFSNKEVGKKNEALADSLKQSEYPYLLPIWGAKVTEKGYNLPYSAGLSVNYFWQESDLIINNLMVGFNNGPQYNIDDLIRFDKAVATASAINFRPDVWVFPFLNVYGIFGRSTASTDVGFGLWLPDSTSTPKEVASAGTVVDFNAGTFGLGMTPTIGVGGGFLALDMNVSWTDVPQLSKPTFVFVFGPRLGKSFKLKKPDSNIAVWTGGFRVKFRSDTQGSVNLGDIFPIEDWNAQIENGKQMVNDSQQQVDAWWEELTPVEQKNPINIAKHESANELILRAGEFVNSAEQAVATAENSTVQYSMDKKPKDMWNFLLGAQYQYNKHLMLRGEVGFLSSRLQVMTSLQYRFGL